MRTATSDRFRFAGIENHRGKRESDANRKSDSTESLQLVHNEQGRSTASIATRTATGARNTMAKNTLNYGSVCVGLFDDLRHECVAVVHECAGVQARRI